MCSYIQQKDFINIFILGILYYFYNYNEYAMNNDFRKRIRKLREQKGYSQEYMAYELGINQASYAIIENNTTRLSVERLFHISQVLQINIVQLLSAENQFSTSLPADYTPEHPLVSKLIECYEDRLREKEERIRLLTALLEQT